eukprot:TRINITY_DN8715_c0_g1_i3.p1 TRINITY_DN8715_c0_g1~~TRINITY_DN8715_c0_g1_i3.p1  ORF type:complete len:286 (+),score=49.49 TRINITY_DN8715_c0_g1_i3:250-1107(+)
MMLLSFPSTSLPVQNVPSALCLAVNSLTILPSDQGCENGRRITQGRLKNAFLGVVLKRKCFDTLQASPTLRRLTPDRCVTAIFTGIVEEMGQVAQLQEVDGGWELTVEAAVVLEDVKLGDSIAVNGTCLTVTRFDSHSFVVGLAPETLRKTSLGEALPGMPVNLERSLRPDSRMGGHFVQGHVDGTGTIKSFREEGDSLWVTIEAKPELLRYIVPKGYIAVDGASLTVVDVLDESQCFTFMLVAYTQQNIGLPKKKLGDKVNLEVDIVGKYVERAMQGYGAKVTA